MMSLTFAYLDSSSWDCFKSPSGDLYWLDRCSSAPGGAGGLGTLSSRLIKTWLALRDFVRGITLVMNKKKTSWEMFSATRHARKHNMKQKVWFVSETGVLQKLHLLWLVNGIKKDSVSELATVAIAKGNLYFHSCYRGDKLQRLLILE